ncbi:MAG: hypothetical protein AAFV43_06115 [Planctomycetota bacterium]
MASDPPKVLLTRKTWAAYMLPAFLLAAVLGSVAAWTTGQLRFAAAPLNVLGVWAAMHYLTSRKGNSYVTIRETPGAVTLLWFLGAAFLLCIALVAVDAYWLRHRVEDSLFLFRAALFSPPLFLMFIGGYVSDRRRRQDRRITDDLS